MFLLSKLDNVSRRFPDDVESTREFLLDRGIPADSAEALTHFSARLAIDPSFRRDVTSLVHVVIRRENEAVDYMDLLGILVAAASGAGPLNANEEQEESVREILRFLTQIRRPTGAVAPVFVRSQNVIPPMVAAEALVGDPASLPVRGAHDLASRPVSSVPFSQVEESNPSRRRGAAIWIAGVMALAVALGWAWMFYHGSQRTPPSTAALPIAPSPSLPVNEKDEPTKAPVGRVRKPQAPSIRIPSPAVTQHSNGLRTPRIEPPITEQPAPLQPAVVAGMIPASKPWNAIPESTAKSTAPENTAATNTPTGRRRLPKSVVINPGPLRRSGEPSGSLNAPGVVHPASIGMMASRLISSPAPPYPVAASQARIQGEVRVRAVVDRDGNVIDARVVSGPELLRDVSLEAVQHWRFRPYTQGGKPVEVATTAILDFELP